jgi:ABC-2 type transport system permease protein
MTPFEILVGKSLPGLIIAVLEASFIIVIIVFWFHVPLRGSVPALYCGLFLFLLSAIGIGLMISSLSATQQQGLMGAFLFLVPAVILSGFATPIENMPVLVQWLTYLNPMRYFLIIVRSVFLQGASFDLLWSQFWPMGLIGIVTLSTAAVMFRRRMY